MWLFSINGEVHIYSWNQERYTKKNKKTKKNQERYSKVFKSISLINNNIDLIEIYRIE